MPNGARVLMDNVFYHIIVRGNQKQKVFTENTDFETYLKRIERYKRKYRFRLYGFCLMPNHIHMIGEIERKEDLAKFMHGLSRSYTAYFNDKYDKVGYLWQGRFKSKIIVKDQYVINCINYIELNPVRAKIVSSPGEYQWSSYKERVLSLNNDWQILDTIRL